MEVFYAYVIMKNDLDIYADTIVDDYKKTFELN